MWCGKKSFKGLALALLTSFATVWGADDIAPFKFSGNLSAEQQGEYWEDLMAFKLWASNSLDMAHAIMTDSIGAVGAGGHATFHDDQRYIGGPIYIGGGISGGTGDDHYLTGPGRIKGLYSSGGNPSHFNGRFCVENMQVPNALTTGSVNVKKQTFSINGEIIRSITDSRCDEVMNFVPQAGLPIPGHEGLNNAIRLSDIGGSNVTRYIDVPPQEDNGKNVFDFVIDNINFTNNSNLIVRVQSKNIYARIFVTNSFTFHSHTNIKVAYVKSGAQYNFSSHSWNINEKDYEVVPDNKYVGNLLFYMEKDFSTPAMDSAWGLQGTFMCPGKMTLGNNMNLVGQILAKDVKLDYDFKGDFRYMPFKKTEINLDPLNKYKDGFPEGSGWIHEIVGIEKATKTNIQFDYCFQMGGSELNGYNAADKADFETSGHSFPICNDGKKGTVVIPPGSRFPTNSNNDIWLNIKSDDKTEGDEYVYLKIYNMNGAVLPGNKDEGGFIMKLIDSNHPPKSANASFTATEDEIFTIPADLFIYVPGDVDQSKKQKDVVIVTLPKLGTLYVGDNQVKAGDAISLADLENGKLQYAGVENGFGTPYTTFTFSVRDEDELASEPYTMTVNITPVNDAPKAENAVYTVDESIDGTLNKVTGSIKVTDVDDKSFTYAFDSKDANYKTVNGIFKIDSKNGTISLSKTVDYEDPVNGDTYKINVIVTDANSSNAKNGPQSTTCTVTIKVNDVNEKPDVHDTTFTIKENSDAGSFVGQVFAEDPDTKAPGTNGKITFDALDSNLPFVIDEKGNITVKSNAKLDYESKNTYTFKVTVTDNGNPQKQGDATVTVKLSDEPEKPNVPDITKHPYSIDEHVSGKTQIPGFKEVITDPDKNEKITATLADSVSCPKGYCAVDLFEVNVEAGSNSNEWYLVGYVKKGITLDYETLCKEWNCGGDRLSIPVRLTVTDKDGHLVKGGTNIVINDIDEKPTIEDAEFEVSEDSTRYGYVVGLLSANDTDLPNAVTNYGKLTYSFIQDNAFKAYPNFPFSLDDNKIFVSGTLDYETQPSYTFKVEVKDAGGLKDTADVTINVKDEIEKVKFLDADDFRVRENTAKGTEVARFELVDPDNTYETIKVSLADNTTKNKVLAEKIFTSAIVKENGKYYFVIKVGDSALLDYEEIYKQNGKDQFNVALTATTRATSTENIVITIVDVNERPTAENFAGEVNEHQRYTDPNFVGKIVASDPDVYNPKYSSLVFTVDGEYDAVHKDTRNPFIVDELTGEISLRQTLDFEKISEEWGTLTPEFKFNVIVSDTVSVKGEVVDPVTIAVTIKLKNIEEPPEVTLKDGEVKEHSPNGTKITPVDAKYSEIGGTVTFTLDAPKAAEGLFEVKDGYIVVKNSEKLDYETLREAKLETVTVTVTAKGSGGSKQSGEVNIVVIDVNEAPTAKNASKTIPENSANGMVVVTVTASDPDIYYADDLSGTVLHDLSFFIVEQNVPFSVTNKGVIKVKDSSKLDYETVPEHKFTFHVVATDGEKDATATVVITLSDENDPPTLDLGADTWPVKESPESKTGDSVGVAVGNDADGDVLTYSMTAVTAGATDLFKIDSKTGKVSVKDASKLDYEALTTDTYTVTITVTDPDGESASADKDIQIIDVNEEPVVAKTKLEVEENSAIGTTVGKVDAKDPDTKNPKFGTLYYSINKEYADDLPYDLPFDVNDKGEIYVVKGEKLNYERKNRENYTFLVDVTDNKYTKQVEVVVSLKDINEPPELPTVSLNVDENSKAGTLVYNGEFNAFDPECDGKSGCLTYELLSSSQEPDDYKSFSLDPVTGKLTVNKGATLNYEVKDEYYITVAVYDGKKSDAKTLSDTRSYIVTINDVNDAPVVENKSVKIDENTKAGKVLTTVKASDEDRDLNMKHWDKVSFMLADSTKNAASWFSIDKESGVITVAEGADLDYEKNSTIYLKVIATDNGAEGYCTGDGELKDGKCTKGSHLTFKNLSDTAIVTVKLNDLNEGPTIKCVDGDKKCNGPFSIYENSATGTVIHEFVLTDLDSADIGKLKVKLVDEYETDADSLFAVKTVDSKTPGVYTLQIVVKDGSKLDYEKVDSLHSVKIIATDTKGLADTLSRIIKVKDVNEAPTMNPQNYSIKENNSPETYVGYIKNDDEDVNEGFRNNVFSVVGGDTAVFRVTEDGLIYTKRTLDYETDKHSFTLKVKLADVSHDNISVTETMTIRLENLPEAPKIDGAVFTVNENPSDSMFIGQLTSHDPDGEGEIDFYDLFYPSDYVYVTDDGKIYVKDSAMFDFETIESIEVPVYVQDMDGLISDTVVTIRIKDVNEAPIVKNQTITVPEDVKKTTVIGKVEADDPDVKNEKFGKLTFKFVEDSKKFKIDSDGNISTIANLDYEADSLYKLKVEVSDGTNKVTATVTVKVTNVIETSEVKITRGETKDSVYVEPDTIYTNQSKIDLEWTEDGELKTGTSSLKEGKNVIIKTYHDPTKDLPGSDTVIVFVSTAEPYVTVKTKTEDVTAENIYTIVEEVDEKDTAYFVNKEMNDILVTVKDSASDYFDSYVVKAKLDPVNVTTNDLKTISSVAGSELTLNEKKASSGSKTPVNGESVLVSYEDKVDGKSVTVSYETDTKGNIIKQPVTDSKGKVSDVKVITVSTTATIGGKKVVISYKADASTGELLITDAEGNLMTDMPKSDKNGENAARTGAGEFTVSYDYEDADGNMVTVTYVTDEKGKIVKNSEGDTGYSVSYTYKNKFGNSATRSIFVVLDQTLPEVKIVSPTKNEVFHVNFIDVVWTVDGVVQDTLTVQSLEKDVNIITRIYRDKAGNEATATVSVVMKNAKNVDINVETPVTIMVLDSVQKYYETNPPKDGETYAVSIVNPNTGKEEEILIGGTFGEKDGSGEEPYPGLENHIGPTLNIDLRLPIVNSVGGLATLDDLVGKNGLVNLEGVDAANSEKATVSDYVADHCSADFKKNLGSDISMAALYKSTAYVKIWVYTSTGSFVNEYGFSQELNSPEYADKGGMVKLNFELKPDVDAELRTDEGRLFGTGAYVFKSEVTLKSELLCDLPPIGDKSKTSSQMGYVMKSSDDLLKKFGYKRPSTENRVGAKSSKKSKNDEEFEEDDSPKSSSSVKDSKKSSSSTSKDSSKDTAKSSSSTSKDTAKSSSSTSKDSSKDTAKSSSSTSKDTSKDTAKSSSSSSKK